MRESPEAMKNEKVTAMGTVTNKVTEMQDNKIKEGASNEVI